MASTIIFEFVCFGILLLQLASHVNGFKYKCFDGFCETNLNQFCNERKEIRACSICTPDVCEWDNIPQFCNETFCPSLSTTYEINEPQDKSGSTYLTAFIIASACLACVILCIVIFKLCNRKAGKKNGWKQIPTQPIIIQIDASTNTDHDMSDASTSTEPMDVVVGALDGARGGQHRLEELFVNNDTNGGRMGRSEEVMNDVDHHKFYQLGDTSRDSYVAPECRRPTTTTKYPTQETLDEVARRIGNDTELKECPLRANDSGIPSTRVSSFDSLSVDAF